MKNKCIILLSGGLDSVVALALAKQRYRVAFALTFDYGQRTFRPELGAARAVCRYFGVKHYALDISWLGRISRSALTQGKPVGLEHLVSVDDVWVPNRNGVFLSIAAALAESAGIKHIVTGFNREEARQFPDNSRAFVKAFNRSLDFSTRGKVLVISLVGGLDKSEIVRVGIKHKIPFELIYSCYLGRKRMCGKCASCRRLKDALGNVGARKYLELLFKER